MPSMKSVFEDLPLKKQQMLSHLYETDDYKVLKEAIQLLRLNAGKAALDAASWEEVKHLQGQAHGLKLLHQNLKDLHSKIEK